MKKIFSAAMVFSGTVIGAGFASGQEIWIFFGRYGGAGACGVILVGVILAICGAGIFLGKADGDFYDYDSFCKKIGGKNAGKILSFLGTAFMFAALIVMFAGSGALFVQEFNSSYLGGVCLMAAVCFLCFLFGIKGVCVISCVLTPLMLIGMTFLGIYSLVFDTKSASADYSSLLAVGGSAISALIYVSYNLLSVPPVLMPLKNMTRRESLVAGLLGGGILGVLGAVMYFVSLNPSYALSELPALSAADSIDKNFGLFYGILIYFSMLTTAVGNGFGLISVLLQKLKNDGFPVKFTLSLILTIAASLASLCGFSRLIGSLYVAVGYSAVLITFLLISYSVKKLKKLPKEVCRSKGK